MLTGHGVRQSAKEKAAFACTLASTAWETGGRGAAKRSKVARALAAGASMTSARPCRSSRSFGCPQQNVASHAPRNTTTFILGSIRSMPSQTRN